MVSLHNAAVTEHDCVWVGMGIHACAHMCMEMRTFGSVCVCVHICVYVCVYVHVCVSVYFCVYACWWMCACICVYNRKLWVVWTWWGRQKRYWRKLATSTLFLKYSMKMRWEYFKGSRPESCISSLIYSRDTPFWLEIFNCLFGHLLRFVKLSMKTRKGYAVTWAEMKKLRSTVWKCVYMAED